MDRLTDHAEKRSVAGAGKSRTYITLKAVGEHEWRFHFPRLTEDVYDQFHSALEWMDAGDHPPSVDLLRKLVKRYPEFIDARHHLAIALAAWDPRLEIIASDERRLAVETGLQVFPPDFIVGRDLLEWGWLDNRPFLRAYSSLALEASKRGHSGEALAICQDLLDLNPNDNQGARSMAVNCLLDRRRPLQALALCERYPDDTLPAVLYGRALALFMLNRLDEAAGALKGAAQCLPLVAKELMKKTHRAPPELNSRYVTVGGADQAYVYWREAGHFWKRVPEALTFVNRTLRSEGLTV